MLSKYRAETFQNKRSLQNKELDFFRKTITAIRETPREQINHEDSGENQSSSFKKEYNDRVSKLPPK